MNPIEVVIDPGHGDVAAGSSTAGGVRGPRGVLEKDVTLRIADEAVRALGPRAMLTRATGAAATLGARAEFARRFGARVFISVHANSGPPAARGVEGWVHDRAGATSHELAEAVLDRLASVP